MQIQYKTYSFLLKALCFHGAFNKISERDGGEIKKSFIINVFRDIMKIRG